MEGLTTDVYFSRTLEVLSKKGMEDQRALAEFTVGSLPDGWPWAVLCGVEEFLNLFEGRPVSIWGLPEGTVFRARDHRGYRVPILTIDGPYFHYSVYETPALGFICHSSGVATMAARCRKAAGDRRLISFGIRRMHPFLTPAIDRAAFIGGCDGVSSLLGAEIIGERPIGTMPHALMIMFGDEGEAFRAFDEAVNPSIPRVALVDTYSDEKFGAIKACETINELFGVRLDTPGSRKGDFGELIREVRWEMDIRGFQSVEIIVSGGLDERKLMDLKDSPVDGYGVGTSISNAPTVDFAMDIVERDGVPVAKRGKLGGRKETYRCEECMEMGVTPFEKGPPKCPRCGTEMVRIGMRLMKEGNRLTPTPTPRELRERVLAQLGRVNLEITR